MGIEGWGVSAASPPPPPPWGFGKCVNICIWTHIARFLYLRQYYVVYELCRRLRPWVDEGWVRPISTPPPSVRIWLNCCFVYRSTKKRVGASSPPPPPVGFWFLYMHSNPISRFLAMPKNTRQYSTYIGLRLLVDKYGVSPPPPPDRVSIRVHAFEPHFKIHGFVNGYTSVTPPILVYDCWSTNTGCMYMHLNTISRFLAMPMHTYKLYLLYWSKIVGLQIRGSWGEALPRRVPIRVHAFEPHFKIPG